MPAARMAGLRSISSARLFRVARPVHGAAGFCHAVFQAQKMRVQITQGCLLDSGTGGAQFFPIWQLRRYPRGPFADGCGGLADVAAQLGVAQFGARQGGEGGIFHFTMGRERKGLANPVNAEVADRVKKKGFEPRGHEGHEAVTKEQLQRPEVRILGDMRAGVWIASPRLAMTWLKRRLVDIQDPWLNLLLRE